MQVLSQGNLRQEVKPCTLREVKGFDVQAWCRRLMFDEMLAAMEISKTDDQGESWDRTCEVVAGGICADEDGTPLFATTEAVKGESVAFVRALALALVSASGGGDEGEATEETAKN